MDVRENAGSVTKILHATDFHMVHRGEPLLGFELDLAARFERLLQVIAESEVDLVVLTGDFVKTDDRGLYEQLAKDLAGVRQRVVVCGGNHDDNESFAATLEARFESPPKGGFSRLTAGKCVLYVLDTRASRVEPATVDRLGEAVRGDEEEGRPVCLFMHHPPVAVGCRYIDEYYPLGSRDLMEGLLRERTGIRSVFCGHVHAQRDLDFHATRVHTTPALSVQFDTTSDDFRVSDTRAAYRMIELDGDTCRTWVEYLEA